MSKKNPLVDTYLVDGCGRCSLYKTPQCKVHTWSRELKALRKLVLEAGLDEELKWKQPAYTLNGSIVVMVSCFKGYAFISFFKGSLLEDKQGLLYSPGENSQAARQLRFTDVAQIKEQETVIKSFLHQAIELEQSGARVEFKKEPESIPEELRSEFARSQAFRDAFFALTPGRQRGYLLHFNQAKQAKTRTNRIEKSMAKIFDGKGLND